MRHTNFDKIRDYYTQGKEWDRLETAVGKLEYLRTLNLIEQYIPEPCRILDLGGELGRYTIALAQRNHQMSLADLSPGPLPDLSKFHLKYSEKHINLASFTTTQ